MREVTIAEAENDLVAPIDQVRAGEAVLITDRGVPVARLEPVAMSPELLDGPTTSTPEGFNLVDSVIEERRSGW